MLGCAWFLRVHAGVIVKAIVVSGRNIFLNAREDDSAKTGHHLSDLHFFFWPKSNSVQFATATAMSAKQFQRMACFISFHRLASHGCLHNRITAPEMDFISSFRQLMGWYLKIVHDSFLPCTFLSTIHDHPTIWCHVTYEIKKELLICQEWIKNKLIFLHVTRNVWSAVCMHICEWH